MKSLYEKGRKDQNQWLKKLELESVKKEEKSKFTKLKDELNFWQEREKEQVKNNCPNNDLECQGHSPALDQGHQKGGSIGYSIWGCFLLNYGLFTVLC